MDVDGLLLRGQPGKLVGDLLAHHVDEVRRLVVDAARAKPAAALDCARSATSAGDVFLVRHRAQDDVAALDGVLRVDERRVQARVLNDAGDQRRFADGQVRDVLAEEEPRRFGDAVNGERAALAEIDVVQIQLEDLVLRRAPLEHERHERLLHLAAVRTRAGCSSLLNSSVRKNIRASCCVIVLPPTGYLLPPTALMMTARITLKGFDAGMRVVALVLDREHRLLHPLRNRVERRRGAASHARRSSSARSAAADRA